MGFSWKSIENPSLHGPEGPEGSTAQLLHDFGAARAQRQLLQPVERPAVDAAGAAHSGGLRGTLRLPRRRRLGAEEEEALSGSELKQMIGVL